ncbi:MAG: hypothetical protein RBS39_05500 [Phycisphaerales bacterium]|jgi:hypothetical protein|nr:hypothetical protein [Phycisphaerales bacterium]
MRTLSALIAVPAFASIALAQSGTFELIPSTNVAAPGDSVDVLVRLSVSAGGGSGIGAVQASVLLEGEDGVGGIIEDAGETPGTWMFGRLPTLRLGGANGPGAGSYDPIAGTISFDGVSTIGDLPFTLDVFRFTVTRNSVGVVDLSGAVGVVGVYINGGPANFTIPGSAFDVVGAQVSFVPTPGTFAGMGLATLVVGSRRRR